MGVGPDSVENRLANFLAGVGNLYAVDSARVPEPIQVFLQAKDGWAVGQCVSTNAFKDTGAIVDDVRGHVHRCLIPGNQLTVEPNCV